MTAQTFPALCGIPYYDEPSTYLINWNRLRPWEFNGWKAESLSWKTGCYIHSGLSDSEVRFTGPDVMAFFESICVNNFKTFSIGAMKHAIFCGDNGLIAAHAVVQRNDEQELRHFAGRTVEIGRIGMSGNLACEIRGPLEEGPDVYDAVFGAGRGLGIQRLGWRTYLVNHVEGGFPQVSWTFWSAMMEERGFAAFLQGRRPPVLVSGSVDPADMRARYRTPVEVGWQGTVKLNHDFIGCKALEAEMANPRRTVATLRWNVDDVLDIHRSLYEPGEEYRTLDLPTSPTWKEGMLAHADHILKNGRRVGYSSGTIYSFYFRETLSMAYIDVEHASIGTEVEVQWGDYGKRIKSVRATVERFPYLVEGRNDQVDTQDAAPAAPGRSSDS